MTDESVRILNFFAERHLKLSPEWLTACIEWCKSEQLIPANHTWENVRDCIYQQWLESDLREVEVPTLPPGLSAEKHTVLQNDHFLQIMKIVDISQSKYTQIGNIRRMHSLTKDEDSAPKPNRMLLLTLSDGVQEVDAMEYELLPEFSINTAPGCKVRLNGNVTVRRGRILLKSDSLKLLGGSVDDLKVVNAPENVLARFLKLKENPNPLNVAIEENIAILDQTANHPTNQTVVKQNTITQIAEKPKPENIMDDEYDEILANIDFEADFNELEPQTFENNASSNLNPTRNTIRQPYNEIVPLKTLQERDITFGVFKIRAKFKEVTKRLNLVPEFELQIKIEDDSGEMVVDFENSVVEKIANCSVSEYTRLKNGFLQEVPEAVERFKEILLNLRDKIKGLDGCMEVRMESNKTPIIVNVFV